MKKDHERLLKHLHLYIIFTVMKSSSDIKELKKIIIINKKITGICKGII